MAVGWIVLAFGMYLSTKRLDLLISFSAASRLRILQVVGLGFLFVPINLSAYVGVPPEKGNNVSGLTNFMRNLREQRRDVDCDDDTGAPLADSPGNDCVPRDQLRSCVPRPGVGAKLAIGACRLEHGGCTGTELFGRVYGNVLAQSQTLAYIDTFMLLAVAAAVMFGLSFIVRRNEVGGKPVVME